MSWFKKLSQLISGPNSKTVMRVEQSDWSRESTMSVEVTVETDVIVLRRVSDASSRLAGSDSDEECGQQ
jgi:hypothetical protein